LPVARAALAADAPPPKPNVVILLADDLGWGDVGYNGSIIDTPNIDRLAQQGVRLTNFRVEPLCSPTRAGLMTGRWPIRCGMGESVITPWRKHGLPTTEHTLADLLAEAGYQRRAAIGKWHLGHYQKKYLPLNRGFTFFYGHYNGAFDYFTHKREKELDWHRNWDSSYDEGYSTDLIGSEAVRFIAENPAGEPFFLYVPFNAPHSPMQAKEEDIAKYEGRVTQKRPRIYAAMVDSMDQAIGKILAAIDEKGIRDNTFVLFTSDNGGAMTFGAVNHPWRSGKGNVYEGGVRVPAVVHWPAGQVEGGGACEAMMGLVDVYPTIKRIAGVTTQDPRPLDGIDVLDIIRGKQRAPQRPWFSYIAQGSADKTAVLEGRWKLIVMGGPATDVPLTAANKLDELPQHLTVELFDLDQDPGERSNIAAENPKVVAALLKQLHEFRSLKLEGIPHFQDGMKQFVAPQEWKIED
jgi:arylsulfatase B